MRFGLFTSMGAQTYSNVLNFWLHAEATGWDIACVTDHFMPNTARKEGPVAEAWTMLSALAARVPRMQLGTIVLGNTYRHPAVVAKMAAQLDHILEGRLLLGIGAGWQQNEHNAYGIPFFTTGERLQRLDEASTVMRRLWTEERVTFNGQHYQLNDAPLEPKPFSKPYPELMIGGGGERVTLRIAARHADHWNVWGGPRVLTHKGAVLDRHCDALGRDPATIRRSANVVLQVTDRQRDADELVAAITARMGWPAEIAEDICLAGSQALIEDKLSKLAEAGVDTLFVPTLFRPFAELRDDLDRLIEDVAPAFRQRGGAT